MDVCYVTELELGFGFAGLTSGLGDRFRVRVWGLTSGLGDQFCVFSVSICVEEHVMPSRGGTKLNNGAAR